MYAQLNNLYNKLMSEPVSVLMKEIMKLILILFNPYLFLQNTDLCKCKTLHTHKMKVVRRNLV